MTMDLREILDGWDYEPGKISVRKIIGQDGHEKIQTRVDLGILQFEPNGRPDGRRPYGCDSMLTFFETRLDEHLAKHGSEEGFVLLPEDCRDLRHEAHLYYQRYLSLFVLEEYEGVEEDTERNLRLIELCRDYGETEYDQTALESQWAYVLMMHTRAKAYLAIDAERFETALALLEHGRTQLLEWEQSEDRQENETASAEMEVLDGLRDEIYEMMPANSKPRLERELALALEQEDYEMAAILRDRLNQKPADE
jgi:hypothetical protein